MPPKTPLGTQYIFSLSRALLFSSLFIGGFLIANITGCSSVGKIDTDTAQGNYEYAEYLAKNERYEESVSYLNDIKNKFPYSKFATLAQLKIADIQFKRENFIEAENAYKLFKDFHPSHQQSDYVTFQIAMSIYRQLPTSIDRDLSLAKNAIIYFQQVYTTYPQSDYAGSAHDHEIKCLQKLARKELYIADYYAKQDIFDSALGRYEGVLKTYPKIGLDARALYGATRSAIKLKQNQKAKSFYQKLTVDFSSSKWAKKAKSEWGTKL